MARKKKTSASGPSDITPRAHAFADRLGEALERFNQPEWLGQHSPLATPYFLGEFLLEQPANDTAIGRGAALQNLLRRSLERLREARGGEAARLLQQIFIERANRQRLALDRNMSLSTLHRERREAVGRLEPVLMRLVNPSLRLERPQPLTTLYGREDDLRRCIQAIKEQHALAIVGQSGVGKTVLAGTLVQHLAPGQTFWVIDYRVKQKVIAKVTKGA